ncbi:ATP-binding protein [Streptomyces spiramyceticus]|uniref:ATP-binding protein n=1 Tax=Streptomyces spiramyceticus TaxID=299717 RepID=UPI00237B268E|nr:ATP-binding protein [Streptomyces spiramyceticus]
MVDETRNTVSGQARVGTLVQAGSVGELHVHEAPPPEAEHAPCQLPPQTHHFEDRETEQATVFQSAGASPGAGDGACEGAGAGREGPLLVALSGIGGVGKTALAHQLARGLRERCPDGILYVDLDDHRREGGTELTDCLEELLRPLGVRTPWLAPSLPGRRKQFWERTQHKRLVVILDNVRYGTEAEALLPSSAGSVAVVISHSRLYDIEGDALLELPSRRWTSSTPYACCTASSATRGWQQSPRRQPGSPICAAVCPPPSMSPPSGCASTAAARCAA